MIFVTTGTVQIPFKRMVDKSMEIFGGLREKVIIQAGCYKTISYYSNITLKDYFTFEKTLEYYKTADIIISSCGEASVFLILKYSKNVPIFFPRLKKYKEHVDNQQLEISKYIYKNKLGKVVYESQQLTNSIRRSQFPISLRVNMQNNNLKLVKMLDSITV